VLDEQGRVTHLIHDVTDVTAQTLAAVRLRESQVREQAANEAAERQRGELERIFAQAPVAIATFRGPRFVIELANPMVLALWDRTKEQALGTPLFELLPEITGQGFDDLLNQVMATGENHVAKEMPSTIVRNGRPETVHWDFVYLPLREDNGTTTGVMAVATEVSGQRPRLARKTVDSASATASAGPVQRDGRSRIPATKMCVMATEFTKKIAEWTSLRPTMALLRQRCRAGACAGIISSV